MLRKMLTVSALGALMIAPAYAAEPPANAEACHKLHGALADAVNKATPPADSKAKLDALFAKLKSNCDTSAFAEAGQVIAEIRDSAGIKN